MGDRRNKLARLVVADQTRYNEEGYPLIIGKEYYPLGFKPGTGDSFVVGKLVYIQGNRAILDVEGEEQRWPVDNLRPMEE